MARSGLKLPAVRLSSRSSSFRRAHTRKARNAQYCHNSNDTLRGPHKCQQEPSAIRHQRLAKPRSSWPTKLASFIVEIDLVSSAFILFVFVWGSFIQRSSRLSRRLLELSLGSSSCIRCQWRAQVLTQRIQRWTLTYND